MAGVGKAILEHEFIWLALAVYFGSVLQDFIREVTRSLIFPLLDWVLNSDGTTGEALHRRTFRLGGSHVLHTGDVMFAGLNLVIAIGMVVVIWRSIGLL